MATRPQLLIFTRAPTYGRGKSRLAASTSGSLAVNFQRQNLAALLRRLGGHKQWQLRLFLTPETPRRQVARQPLLSGQRLHWQGMGDLGQRMQHALSPPRGPRLSVSRQPVLLIGSDIPGIRASDIRAALQSLRRRDIVIGPASDGGYWLIGWRQCYRRPFPALTPVRWSSPHALADTRACLAADGYGASQVAYLRALTDADDRDSLRQAAENMRLP